MLIHALVLFPPLLLAQGPAPERAPQAPTVGEDVLGRVARAVAGRLATVEVVGPGGADQPLYSRPGVVIGPKHVMTIAPALERLLEEGAAPPRGPVSIRVQVQDSGEGARWVRARLVQTDPQTGLVVMEAEELGGAALQFQPAPGLAKEAPVVLVEPGGRGRMTLRRGRLIQTRAHLDQGRGKNPLLLFKLEDPGDGGSRSYTKWDHPLSSGAGAFLADLQGGFLGIVTPPALDPDRALRASGKVGPSGKPGGALRQWKKPALKEGEVLALPGEIARLVSESLARAKVPVRGYFGASFREVREAPEELRRLGSALPAVRVESVYPGGPADQGGLRAGDWLVQIAEKSGISYPEVVHFSELVEYGGQGKTVHLVVARPLPRGDGRGPPEGRGGGFSLKLFKLKIRIGTR